MADVLGTTYGARPHLGNDNSPSLRSTSCRPKKYHHGGSFSARSWGRSLWVEPSSSVSDLFISAVDLFSKMLFVMLGNLCV